MKPLLVIVLGVLLLSLLAGCGGSGRTVNHFPRGHTGLAHTLEKGRIVSQQSVVIDGSSSLVGTSIGAAVGTAAGAAASGSIEDERDLRQTIGASAVGGAVGAIVGQVIEKKLTERHGQELQIELEDGERLVVIQEVENKRPFQDGEKVLVYTTQSGVSRVYHEDQDPYIDPETNAYIVNDELEETEFEPVTF